MDRAMTIRLAAARSRVACLSCSLVSVISRCARWLKMTVAWVARLAASKLNAKMSTASGLAEYLPSRLLVNGMRVMVKKNAKFHQARLSRCPATRRNTR